MKPWKKRLLINIPYGNETFIFLSKSGMHLATGYNRVVIGKRGPYIEFDQWHVVFQNFTIPDEEEYRIKDARAFYVEYRSKCVSYVKLYAQKRKVAYADYKIGCCYISPFDLGMASSIPIVF